MARQVDLPAPERADRHPRADGLLRAGDGAPISASSTACSRRVGAADDLARGRSTFMVEMVETAAILNQAGERALVILDEIGRGTATFDGLSIAWAAVEHLHEMNRCRALFATHYHELTALAEKLPRLANATMRVKEWKGDVVFLHEVARGAADRSYGIQVARLAGLPRAVVERAREILHQLEAGETPARPTRSGRRSAAFLGGGRAASRRSRSGGRCAGRRTRRARSRRDDAARGAWSALPAEGDWPSAHNRAVIDP